MGSVSENKSIMGNVSENNNELWVVCHYFMPSVSKQLWVVCSWVVK